MDLRSAFFASLTATWLALPALLHRAARPSWRRLVLVSSFHHLLDLAQMVTFRTYLSRILVMTDWIQPISSSISSVVASSSRIGRSVSCL